VAASLASLPPSPRHPGPYRFGEHPIRAAGQDGAEQVLSIAKSAAAARA
jgi:hypothetical protein